MLREVKSTVLPTLDIQLLWTVHGARTFCLLPRYSKGHGSTAAVCGMAVRGWSACGGNSKLRENCIAKRGRGNTERDVARSPVSALGRALNQSLT